MLHPSEDQLRLALSTLAALCDDPSEEIQLQAAESLLRWGSAEDGYFAQPMPQVDYDVLADKIAARIKATA